MRDVLRSVTVSFQCQSRFLGSRLTSASESLGAPAMSARCQTLATVQRSGPDGGGSPQLPASEALPACNALEELTQTETRQGFRVSTGGAPSLLAWGAGWLASDGERNR